MKLNTSFFCLGLIALVLFSCSQPEKKTEAPDFLAANIDTTINPAEDFFGYANGAWIKRTTIPAWESGWGIGNMVQEEIYQRLLKINEEAAVSKAGDGTVTQKIGDFWISGMDSADIDKKSLGTLQPDLDAIAHINSIDDIINVTADFHNKGIRVLFSDGVNQDDKNSSLMIYVLGQGGLGLPNRDYYFKTDARTVKVRQAYNDYLVKTFLQLDADSVHAAKNASGVFALETVLAASSRKLVDLQDPYKNYNKMSLGSVKKLAPSINWDLYLKKIGISQLDSANIGQPEFYAALSKELKSEPIEVWKNYLRFSLIRSSAAYLDSQTFKNALDYRLTLTGAVEPKPRWKRVLDAEQSVMGEALGQLFVKEYFNETAKKRYSDIVEAMRDAYKERIRNLSWMSDSTKEKALIKLAAINKKVGYPDKWKDISELKIDRGPFVLNMRKASAWWRRYNINKLGKPVDYEEWSMSPQTYNASYDPDKNQIELPAGQFVVPGKKDEELDDAFVYGYAAASTIGHEMTHGFDDEGRLYDAKGNLRNWWQPSDEKQFKIKAQGIINEFNAFVPVDTLHVNGEATQGENIADLGGLMIGLDAFRKTEFSKKDTLIGGLKPLQRFFLGYAYGWMMVERKERIANQVMTDEHAPAKERVNGPMANIPEFYEAFNVKPGDKMWRPDSLRVKIW